MNKPSSSKLQITVQVFQWIFENSFVYLFCKNQEGKRIIFKVHSLNLKGFVLVDDASSLPDELIEDFQNFLSLNLFQNQIVFKKRFGTFFDASGEKCRLFKFIEITHSNEKPLYYLRNILKSFERKHSISLKTFHMKIDSVVRIFQQYPNLKPCMFIGLDTSNPLVNCIPARSSRVSKGLHKNYQADAMYSFPISQLKPCNNPPPFNFPLRIVAFDFETTGTVFEKDDIYQASFVFETVFTQKNIQKEKKKFLLNVGTCKEIDDVTVKSFQTEKELIVEMINLLMLNEWDCIIGYNIYGKIFSSLITTTHIIFNPLIFY